LNGISEDWMKVDFELHHVISSGNR